ncbi:MAG: tripartite tricarboxylate transporter permease, partial [Desulfobacterales bacterium]|nr:tripartite tricarboxylate transporter permease [Desulfobacterales bacterium]
MLDQLHLIVESLFGLFSFYNFTLMLTGIAIGFVFGIIPGLSGLVALTLMLPLIYEMDPNSALVFLLSSHAIVTTGGSISAILLGIPGTEPNAATIIDGFPMTQQGRGGRALGAGLMSSLLGGLFGALVLVIFIPVLLPIALAFKSPELFLLIILGLLCIVILSKGHLLKGILSGVLGLIISFVGYQGLTAMHRFTFDSLYLYDGIKLVPLGLGLFAIPVIIDLTAKGTIITDKSKKNTVRQSEVWEGVKDVFRHFWLFIRCSAIGAWMGILPGVGGTVATFIAYGHARATSKNRDNFGNGEVEGVIGPEAANNAKEGGA